MLLLLPCVGLILMWPKPSNHHHNHHHHDHHLNHNPLIIINHQLSVQRFVLFVISHLTMILIIQSSVLTGFSLENTNSDSLNNFNRMINPGERLHIPCTMMNPGGSVQWIKNGKPILLDFSSSQRRHWNITKDGQASLTINRVTRADEGTWECWELDNNGNVKQKSHVMKITVANVPEGPFLQVDGQRLEESGRISVREKLAMVVTCIIKGASPAARSINWFLGGINVTEFSQLLMEYSADDNNYESQSVLTINVTKEDHRKTLVCQAEHASWTKPMSVRTSLNIQYEPAFSLIRDPVFGYPVIEGMSLTLRCTIDANPPSQPQWIRDHALTPGSGPGSLSTTTSKLSTEILFTSPDGSLNIASLSFSDSGWYRCTTNHTFGHFTSYSYLLNVKSRSFLKEWSSIMCSSKGSLPDQERSPSDDKAMVPNTESDGFDQSSKGLPRRPYPSPRWSSRYPQRPLPTPDWTFRKPSSSGSSFDINNNDLNSMSSASQNTGSAFGSRDGAQDGRSRLKSVKSFSPTATVHCHLLMTILSLGLNFVGFIALIQWPGIV